MVNAALLKNSLDFRVGIHAAEWLDEADEGACACRAQPPDHIVFQIPSILDLSSTVIMKLPSLDTVPVVE